jgi:hypothetical protein
LRHARCLSAEAHGAKIVARVAAIVSPWGQGQDKLARVTRWPGGHPGAGGPRHGALVSPAAWPPNEHRAAWSLGGRIGGNVASVSVAESYGEVSQTPS